MYEAAWGHALVPQLFRNVISVIDANEGACRRDSINDSIHDTFLGRRCEAAGGQGTEERKPIGIVFQILAAWDAIIVVDRNAAAVLPWGAVEPELHPVCDRLHEPLGSDVAAPKFSTIVLNSAVSSSPRATRPLSPNAKKRPGMAAIPLKGCSS